MFVDLLRLDLRLPVKDRVCITKNTTKVDDKITVRLVYIVCPVLIS